MHSKISVIIPTYNRVFYLEEAVKSIQNQEFDNYEILIIDDGSTDNSRQKINYLSSEDSRIRYFYQENKGRSAARNAGIDLCQGDWLLFLDSDDLLDAGALSFLTGKIQEFSEVGIIGGTYVAIDEQGDLISNASSKIKKFSREGVIEEPYVTLINNYYLPMGSYIVRRDIVKESGYFQFNLDGAEDYDFCLRMVQVSKLAYFNKTVAKFRRHKENTSQEMMKEKSSEVARKHLAEMKNHRSIKNKEAIISEWKKFIADDFFARKEFKNSLYNHAASAFYDPKKILSKEFYKRIISCLLPESLKKRIKGTSPAII